MSSICLNELSNYNSGRLEFKWFNLDSFTTADDFSEAIDEWLLACPSPDGGQCEEWNIGDIEDVPEKFYGDFSFDAEAFYEYKAIAEELGNEEILKAYLRCFGTMPADADQLQEKFFKESGEYEDTSAFYIDIGFDLIEENGYLDEFPEMVRTYFDYEKYGRDVYINDMASSNGFLFWNH